MNKKKKAEINAFYEMYKKEKGEKMYYKFKCENCRYCNKWGEVNSNSPNCKKM